MPFFWAESHFQAIRALLLAGDIQARIVHHDADPASDRLASHSIQVKRSDGATVLWTNSDKTWCFSVIKRDGEIIVGRTGFPNSIDAEAVAKLIAVSELPERDFATYDSETGQYVLTTGEPEPSA